MNDDNRRIAKNTIYLYSRMIVMMLVTLYTSRIILEKLGVDDYGIYQAVGGIVGFLSFIKTLSKILCKWKQDSVVSLFLYLNSVFKHKHKLIHNQAPV